jgi:hypothetical protein
VTVGNQDVLRRADIMRRLPSDALPTPAALAVDAGEGGQQAPFDSEPPLAADALADQALQGVHARPTPLDRNRRTDEISPWRRLLAEASPTRRISLMSRKDHCRSNVRRSSSTATLAWAVRSSAAMAATNIKHSAQRSRPNPFVRVAE